MKSRVRPCASRTPWTCPACPAWPGLAAASNAAGELLAATLFPGASSYSPGDVALHDRIRTYIELTLHEPGLNAHRIAAAHHVSVRTVGRAGRCVDARTARHELSMPPRITYERLKGFTLFTTRTILSGGADEIAELARTNLRTLKFG